MLADEDIQSVVETSSHETVCVDLIEAANQAGGHDNISVTVAYFGPGDANLKSTPPSSR
jgi:serine/threonine protein phosphatase PrpC